LAPTSGFGYKGANPLPFGSSTGGFGGMNAASSRPFGSAQATGTPFGAASAVAPTPFGAAPSQQQHNFNGKSPRELLTTFYEQRNPDKLGEVDKVLQKYRGNEEQMFRNLAKKYNLDPSVFGLSSTPAPTGGFGGSPGFGQPSALGGSSLFGSGGSAAPAPSSVAFGSSGGFGQPSTLSGGMSSGGFGSSSIGGFGASSGSSFGTLAQNQSPFGGASQQAGGFGSSFGGSGFGSGGFGAQSTPFGGPRR
jgi:hypothetical protein